MSAAAQPLEIVFQDDAMVAINKPPGLLVHRTAIDRHESRFALQLLRDQLGITVRQPLPSERVDKVASRAVYDDFAARSAGPGTSDSARITLALLPEVGPGGQTLPCSGARILSRAGHCRSPAARQS